jgi:hypothetical protein
MAIPRPRTFADAERVLRLECPAIRCARLGGNRRAQESAGVRAGTPAAMPLPGTHPRAARSMQPRWRRIERVGRTRITSAVYAAPRVQPSARAMPLGGLPDWAAIVAMRPILAAWHTPPVLSRSPPSLFASRRGAWPCARAPGRAGSKRPHLPEPGGRLFPFQRHPSTAGHRPGAPASPLPAATARTGMECLPCVPRIAASASSPSSITSA